MAAGLKHNIMLGLCTDDSLSKIERKSIDDGLGLRSSQVSDDAFDATYVDDDAMVVAVDKASMILAKASRAMTTIARGYFKYRLKLNFSQQTRAVVVLGDLARKNAGHSLPPA